MTQKNPFLLLDSLFKDLFNNTYSVFEKKKCILSNDLFNNTHSVFEKKINVSCQFFQQLKFNLTACHGSFMIIFHNWKFYKILNHGIPTFLFIYSSE